jgi:hypothetical protein
MNAHSNIPAMGWAAERRFTVEFDQSWLARPLNWKLRIWGPSVGGYGVLNGASSKYADKADAERVGAVWAATGLTPAFQTEDRIAAILSAALTPIKEAVNG